MYASSASSPSPGVTLSNSAQSEAKRRRLRKGTHSCWECKRRKTKCITNLLLGTTTCNGCRRRGTQCVSQEFPEETSHDDLLRLEALHSGIDKPATPDGHGTRETPVSAISGSSRHLAFFQSSERQDVGTDHPLASQSKHERLSRVLHQSLPSREDAKKICAASRRPSILTHETMTTPYDILHENGMATPETLLDFPAPNAHPVLIAKHMLLLATFLQQLHPKLHTEIEGLSEPPRAIMQRLQETAVMFVTANDDLLGSIEGLECIMLDSFYHANIGNLRRSWVTIRRAMSIAQLMGLNRSNNPAQHTVLDPRTKYHPQHMWFRIVFCDRHLCLMLGLSQGCSDRSMASDALLANDTPMGRLERIHCVIASRILERNESQPKSHDIALVRSLDMELQRAARSLPSKWWLIPNLDVTSSSTDSESLFWKTRRLTSQVFHYNLLNTLHLPYMLRSMSAEAKHDYSRITCVNASREMLSRFIALRRFNNVACSCRTIDFLALMAAMTLLLAHIDSHRSETENLLAHQYHSDRAMIEDVQENMKELNRLNSDALSAHSAELLGRLLNIEVQTSDCYPQRAERVSVQEAGSGTAPTERNDNAVVSVNIPYFGIIKIARERMIMEVCKPNDFLKISRPTQWPGGDESAADSPHSLDARPSAKTSGDSNIHCSASAGAAYGNVETAPLMSEACAGPRAPFDTLSHNATGIFPLEPRHASSDSVWQHADYPALAASSEDWAFQGVDMAFFESLMRSAEKGGNDITDWSFVGEGT